MPVARLANSRCASVAFDKQGRVKVDDELRTYAEHAAREHRVVIAGNFDRIEIW